MRRGIIIGLSVMGVILVILALALASVGTELDQTRIEREEYQSQVGDLQEELDGLTQDRERLQQQVDEQLKTIEQWKVQHEPSRASGQTDGASPPAAESAPSPAP